MGEYRRLHRTERELVIASTIAYIAAVFEGTELEEVQQRERQFLQTDAKQRMFNAFVSLADSPVGRGIIERLFVEGAGIEGIIMLLVNLLDTSDHKDHVDLLARGEDVDRVLNDIMQGFPFLEQKENEDHGG